jgi:aminopeptidase-like protein
MKDEMEKYFDRLWPICRSITGNGLRESFKILQEIIPLDLIEVNSGTNVHDWVVPKEWNISEAYIITPDGKRIADFKKNNLHVVNYSAPVRAKLTYEELSKHVHTLPDKPQTIPYITSYYKERWGFCLAHEEWLKVSKEGEFEVVIDSELKEGSMTLGHLILPGKSKKEILFSSYLCHPSMANNELSGPIALAFLYRKISLLKDRHYTYRFVLAPETIGVIAYLSLYGDTMKEKVDAGYVLTCVGDRGSFNYKRSKWQTSLADRAAEHVLLHSGEDYKTREFAVGGSDERQYCSPGYNMPVGSLMRSVYHEFDEYHTSSDDKNYISFEHLAKTVELYFDIVRSLELNSCYMGSVQYGEPMLGKHDMYPSSASPEVDRDEVMRLMHFLTYADGKNALLDVAEKMNCSILKFEEIVQKCLKKGLVSRKE